MRKLIIATAAFAFLSTLLSPALLSSAAFAQDKAGSTTPPAGDTMSKGDDMSKDKMGKKTTKKTAKKSSKMKTDDATK
jgi:pentapeptide MXKDX repeat protein